MAYYVQINDGFCKSLGASTREALVSSVAEYYSLGEGEIEVLETDQGEAIAFVGGEHIGLIENSRHPHTYSMKLAAE